MPDISRLVQSSLTYLTLRTAARDVVDVPHYKLLHEDVAQAGIDPIRHFILHGADEDRTPRSWFSTAYVLNQLNDQSLVGQTAAAAYFRSDMHRRPRLIFVSHDATRTGAPAIILRLLEMFSASKAFECFSILDYGGERLAEFEAVSHTHVMSQPRFDKTISDEERELELLQLLSPERGFAKNRPVCALVNSTESRHIGRSLARAGIPVVSLLHEIASYYPPACFEEIGHFSRKVVFPSKFVDTTAHQYCAIDKDKTVIRGQGLLDDAFGQLDQAVCRQMLRDRLDLGPNATIVLNAGTIDLRKGADIFARTARRFFKDHPDRKDVFFIWFGFGEDGPDTVLDLARRHIETAGLSDNVRFLPGTPDIEQVFMGSDLFLLTARADPFPCVVHEAMACRLPVIGFRDGGGAQEMAGDDCGTFVEMGDVKSLSDAIARYVDDPGLQKKHGLQAMERVGKDWSYADYFRDIYAIIRQNAVSGSRLPDLQLPTPASHLVVLRGTLACVDALDAVLDGKQDGPVSVALVDGRFGLEIEACIEALKARGLDFAIHQPMEDTDSDRRAILSRLLSKPRPQKATLINVLQYTDATQLRQYNYPIKAYSNQDSAPVDTLYQALPAIDQLFCPDPKLVAHLQQLNPIYKDRVDLLQG